MSKETKPAAQGAGPEEIAGAAPGRVLTPEARRALAEAEERRRAAEKIGIAVRPREINGPKGPEPSRYGDWEVKGIASDF